MAIRYVIERHADGRVTASKQVDNRCDPLDMRLDLESHSPDGFECGYEGSGCAQLSLAILADALADDTRAIDVHQDFKHAIIAHLGGPTDGPFKWMTEPYAVRLVVEKIERLGWRKVVEQFDRNRAFPPLFSGMKAFTRRK